MRVALVHYWLVGMRGGEKVLEAMCDIFPDADIYTHVVDLKSVSDVIKRHKIFTSFISRLPYPRRMYQKYLPLMPMALEQFDMRDYDLVISSESGPAKGIIPNSTATHVCYCHSPMRYLWNMHRQYQDSTSGFTRMMMPPVTHYLRTWDVTTAQRVDAFAANSQTVAARLRRYYHRSSSIIYPPVNTADFAPVRAADFGDYYLMVGELVGYKRPDIAVEAFTRLNKKLVVIGKGEMLAQLKEKAGPSVTMLGSQPFEVLRHHYARCKALIFPGEEDFGIVPVETMASGRPVIAYGRGGATETVQAGKTGLFFEHQSVDALIEAIEQFERTSFDPAEAVARAAEFDREIFKEKFRRFVDLTLSAGPSASHNDLGDFPPVRLNEHGSMNANPGVDSWQGTQISV